MMRVAAEPVQKPELLVMGTMSCSTSGIIYVVRTGEPSFPILWSSKKHGRRAQHTEAELNLHTMAEHITEQSIPIPIKFEQDNQAAIATVLRLTS